MEDVGADSRDIAEKSQLRSVAGRSSYMAENARRPAYDKVRPLTYLANVINAVGGFSGCAGC